MRKLRRWIARKLDPATAQDAERYHYLRMEIADAERWLGEFRDASFVLRWLLERDADHWRRLGDKPIGKLPPMISDLRDHMRRSFAAK